MEDILLYPVGITAACRYAVQALERSGIHTVDHPTPEATHLLLDVPSFDAGGALRGGGDLRELLRRLPPSIRVIGGNLDHPLLAGYRDWDLLKQEWFLAKNAAITADCALRVAAPLLTATLYEVPVLVIGWGRIGKCLAAMLKALDCPVTVAARKETDRAMLQSLGYDTALPGILDKPYRVIFNTAPEKILTAEEMQKLKQCVKIDLASRRGLCGGDVVWARGLPGIHAPESSGALIAQTVLSFLKEENP